MQRKLSTLMVAVALFGFNLSSFADEAQPELQPKRYESGWFKKPVDVTTYVAQPAAAESRDFRFITDFSPL